MDRKFEKLAIESLGIDSAYQRSFDEARARAMSREIDDSRIGVPVVSRRADGKLVLLDGQHRAQAKKMAGHGKQVILCEVYGGLTRPEEAALFLKLNNGRKAVSAFDKYRARIVAKEPVALEFTRIVEGFGFRLALGSHRNTISAVQSIESVHRRNQNLAITLGAIKAWGDGEPASLDGDLIKDLSGFLHDHADEIDVESLTHRLVKLDPAMVMRRIRANYDATKKRRLSANTVFREIYNARRKRGDTRLEPIVTATAIN